MATQVENWPGFLQSEPGFNLMERMLKQAEKLQTHIIYDSIHEVDLKRSPVLLKGDLQDYTCHALIIATGAKAKSLGVPGEKEYHGRGVSICATCDGYFYRDLPVVIVGGGNTAVTEALYLAEIASHVTVIHRQDHFRAEPILVEQLERRVDMGKVNVEWNHEIQEIWGDGKQVKEILLKNNLTGVTKTLPTTGLFIAIGHEPNTSLFADQLDLSHGYIVTKPSDIHRSATSLPGIFAAGDVMDPLYQQAITAAASGCIAALDAAKYLKEKY